MPVILLSSWCLTPMQMISSAPHYFSRHIMKMQQTKFQWKHWKLYLMTDFSIILKQTPATAILIVQVRDGIIFFVFLIILSKFINQYTCIIIRSMRQFQGNMDIPWWSECHIKYPGHFLLDRNFLQWRTLWISHPPESFVLSIRICRRAIA